MWVCMHMYINASAQFCVTEQHLLCLRCQKEPQPGDFTTKTYTGRHADTHTSTPRYCLFRLLSSSPTVWMLSSSLHQLKDSVLRAWDLANGPKAPEEQHALTVQVGVYTPT